MGRKLCCFQAKRSIIIWGLLILLPQGDAFSDTELSTKSPQSKKMIFRGVSFEMPLKFRVLIAKHSRSQKLKIKGESLLVNDLPIFKNSLECFFQKEWYCFASKKLWSLRDGLKISSLHGGLSLNSKKYKGDFFLREHRSQLEFVNEVGGLSYIASLLNSEVNATFPQEALKAQAIAARSYALATAADRRKSGSFYDLKNDERDQMYEGSAKEDSLTRKIAEQTQGQLLFHNGEVLKAYYHAANGGFSELPQRVWGESHYDQGAYESRVSPVDRDHVPFHWKIQMSSAMGSVMKGIGKILDIKVVKKTQSGRVHQVKFLGSLGAKTLSGREFRRLFGKRWVKSSYFKIVPSKNSWTFKGKGFGHGVGMSQLGAKKLAKQGKSSTEILKHYYPNADLHKVYSLMKSPHEIFAR